MKRLAIKNINTPEEYDRIYQERKKYPDEFDIKRWKMLIDKFKGGSLIDLGTLDSFVPHYALVKYPDAQVWGLDFAKKTIQELKKKYPRVKYIYGGLYRTGLKNEYFDYVVAGEVIEHLEYPERFLMEAFRILKPGGFLALSTPLEETKAGEVDKERHLWSFSQEDLYTLLKPYGKVKIKILGSRYFPYKYHFKNIICYVKKYYLNE